MKDYEDSLQQVKNILKGNLTPVIQHFKNEMKDYAGLLEFEKADMVRKKIEHLEKYQANSVVVSRQLTNADVFSLLRDGNDAYVNYLMVQNGTIIQTHTSKLEIPLEETDEDILAFAVAQLRSSFNSHATEIVVPFHIEYPEAGITLTVPKGGDKKKLLELSATNVNYFLQEIHKRKMLRLEGKDDMERKKVLYQLQEDLQLPAFPNHIECFDNSNFH